MQFFFTGTRELCIQVVEPLYGCSGRNRSANDRKCVALSEFLFCLFSRFRRHCGYAKLASSVTTQNIFLDMRLFRLKNRRLDGKRARKSTSAGTHITAQWFSRRKQFRTPCKTIIKKENHDLSYHEGSCCCGLCGQLELLSLPINSTVWWKPET